MHTQIWDTDLDTDVNEYSRLSELLPMRACARNCAHPKTLTFPTPMLMRKLSLHSVDTILLPVTP